MSEFAVTYEEIEKTWPIEGADNIELAKVTRFTYQFVIGKGSFKNGDFCVFFPVDSIIPVPIQEIVGMVGKFSGTNGDRVKTKRFKGQISQGFVAPVKSIFQFLISTKGESYSNSTINNLIIGHDLTTDLGVVKYEPPVIEDKAGNLLPLPPGVPKYDIEGCQRNPEIVDILRRTKVRILEKIEGQNASIKYCTDGKVFVSQRNFTIEEIPDHEHGFWKLSRENKLIEIAKSISEKYNKDVVIRFEYVGPGIQKNIYKLNKPSNFIFDIMIGDQYCDGITLVELSKQYNLPLAPVIAFDITLDEWLNGKTIEEASNGESKIFKTKREGIVITPIHESEHHHIGRLILKQRSPEYLEKSDF